MTVSLTRSSDPVSRRLLVALRVYVGVIFLVAASAKFLARPSFSTSFPQILALGALHGNTVEIQHSRTDVAALLPMGMIVADMVPDNPGIWQLHCHVSNHLRMGMQTRYAVTK